MTDANDILAAVSASEAPVDEDAGRFLEAIPPPTNPMAVARYILPSWEHEGMLTLRHWRGTWMRWEGTHWIEVEDQEVRAALYQHLERATYVNVTAKGEPEVKEWAPSKRKIADLMEAFASIAHLPPVVETPSWLSDAEASRNHGGVMEAGQGSGPIVACGNGILDVGDRTLREHSPRLFNLVSVPFDYSPETTAPRWLQFLNQIWPDDPDSIDALQEWFGYVLSGRTDLHKIILIVGPTRSGKGTIARILAAMVGKGNVAGPTLASIGTNFGLSPLLGRSLAVISDARLSGRDSQQVVERLLTVSGEDTIDIDRKYRPPWTGRLPTRFVILSNELPNFGDASGAIARRFVVLTMTASWLGKENTALTDELIAELPGILNWALEGLARLANQGRFTEPYSSADAVTAMQDMASPTSAFVRECCDTGPTREVTVDELWEQWKSWCEHNDRKTGNKQMFGRNLQSVVAQARRSRPRGADGQPVPTYHGISLKAERTKNHSGVSRDSSRLTGPPKAAESR